MKKILKTLFFLAVLGSAAIYLELSGYLYHNDILAKLYKVEGLDVSHHQEKINWKKVSKKYKFVIMKATEGKDFLDTDFFYNWNNARLNGFTVGAYHFFSMLSTGKAQADYYISKVPDYDKAFPPVIDLEIPTKYPKKMVLKELGDMIEKLENHYKKRAVIYVTYHTYKAYIKGEFLENKLWIRDIKFIPELEENDRWIIWQFSNRGRIEGIPGFTDKNVLRIGTVEELIESSRIEN
ncbi:glycoside hydrolase [Leptotrichia sp. OH3620_COT-345]|uniref:glycoside hydrolase family 25 protein n=1 Tax=Leptotrichia sp. OH3620_COT-345 TaxID=2491048 RepID=UPI000F6468A5|nr:GH25 family lysozyme [Leptotrichia sp. OH3620_COT-345]RRD39470.1 glycoside hydrolase [Leptotrichia sp. OH3620_COT-345]